MNSLTDRFSLTNEELLWRLQLFALSQQEILSLNEMTNDAKGNFPQYFDKELSPAILKSYPQIKHLIDILKNELQNIITNFLNLDTESEQFSSILNPYNKLVELKISADIFILCSACIKAFLDDLCFKYFSNDLEKLERNINSVTGINLFSLSLFIDSQNYFSNINLNMKNKELDKIRKNKEVFFKIIVHDLRNPLNIIYNYVRMVLANAEFQKISNEKINTQFQKIFLAVEKMVGITNNLFVVANLGDITIDPILEKNDFVLCLKEIIEDQLEYVQKKEINICYNETLKTLIFLFDKRTIKEAIQNIISEAIKSSLPKGEIKISLQVSPKHISLNVKFNGIGLTEKEISSILDLNYTATDSYEINATLGFFIAKKIVEGHLGSMSINSIPNKETTVKITLPIS